MIRARFARQSFIAGNVGSSEAMTSNCGTAEIVLVVLMLLGSLFLSLMVLCHRVDWAKAELRYRTLHSSLEADLEDLSIISEKYWNGWWWVLESALLFVSIHIANQIIANGIKLLKMNMLFLVSILQQWHYWRFLSTTCRAVLFAWECMI